jgi:hypothetical protein
MASIKRAKDAGLNNFFLETLREEAGTVVMVWKQRRER